MKKRTALAIIGLVVLVALIGVLTTGYIYLQSSKPKPVTTSPVSLDKTPNYGACSIITTDTMKQSANGSRITSIVEGVRIGEEAANGTTAESCSFAFASAASNQNTLTVAVYPYTSAADGTNTEVMSGSWAEVASSNPPAYFSKSTADEGNTTVYYVRVLPGAQNVLFTLKQPAGKETFDQVDALDFLVGIAAKATLQDLKTATPQDVTEGLPPEPEY